MDQILHRTSVPQRFYNATRQICLYCYFDSNMIKLLYFARVIYSRVNLIFLSFLDLQKFICDPMGRALLDHLEILVQKLPIQFGEFEEFKFRAL